MKVFSLTMQSNKSEVITLQAGPLANQVCAHFWNLQEYTYLSKSATNEREFPFTYQVLFDDSTRYAKPHALAIDVREVVDFGARLDPELVPTPLDIPSWNSQVDKVLRSVPVSSKNAHCNWINCLSPFAQRIWCRNDILLKLPVSLQPLPIELTHNEIQPDSARMISTFTEGQNILRSGSKVSDDCDDRIRRIAERCSHPNSFQLVVDAEDGFTGIGSQLLESVTEEFPKSFIFTVPIYCSSAVSHMDARLKRLTVVNQLCLLNILESGDRISHGSWLPMDMSNLCDHSHFCRKMCVLASVLDTVTTPSKLAPKFGGLDLEHFLSVTSFAQGRKMLTVQTGVNCNEETDGHLSWYNFNPYYNLGKTVVGESVLPKPVLSRQLMSRGIKDSGLMNDVWNMFNQVNSSDKSANKSLVAIDIPCLYSTESVRSVYSLPDYPLRTGVAEQANLSLPMYCKQYANTYMTCIVDVPGANSYEAKVLEKLVKSLLYHRSHPIDDYMELETWNEFLESIQARLIDSYSVEWN
ncbi:protein misato [Schistosoma japonicum]|nr:protein misato [Schistosoma japonicum]